MCDSVRLLYLLTYHRAGLVRCSATEPRLLPAEEARSGLPLNFADHALYLGTYLGPRGGS